MLIKLKQEHLDWFLQGKKAGGEIQKPGQYTDAVVRFFKLVYVDGKPRAWATEQFGWSPQFSYKKCQELEKIIRDKCKTNDLLMTTVFHEKQNEESLNHLDKIIMECEKKYDG